VDLLAFHKRGINGVVQLPDLRALLEQIDDHLPSREQLRRDLLFVRTVGSDCPDKCSRRNHLQLEKRRA
jgi:hypothetical protein